MTAIPDDTVSLEIDGASMTGWEAVQVTRGVELMPSHFVLQVTEQLPGDSGTLSINPGARCRLKMGADTVITGYVDRYAALLTPQGHQITVIGRSATADLVDCAAGVTSGEETKARMTFRASSLLQLAQDLCKPFGITVTAPDGEGAPLISTMDGIPQFTIPLNATPFEVLERKARARQRMLMDSTDGNLLIAAVGTKRAASGFSLPGNVISAQVSFDKQDRFTIYLPALFGTDSFGSTADAAGVSANYLKPVVDSGAFIGQRRWDDQPRYRPHFVVSDQQMLDLKLAEQLAKWEAARRYGRSQAVDVTVVGWRDARGAWWQPNTLAALHIPGLKLANLEWLISEITYVRSIQTGTRATIRLMPRETFALEPTFDTPFDPQLADAQRRLEQGGDRRDRSSSNFNPRTGEEVGGL